MTVVYCSEIADGRGGDDETSSKESTRTYERVFRVRTSSAYDEAETVLAYPLVPRIGTPYPYYPAAKCTRRSARQVQGKLVWHVTCSYSTAKDPEENPLADPAEVEWSSEIYQRPYFEDINGDGILNSAGDYFDPPVEGDDVRWVVTVTKNVANVPTWILDYENAVNDAEFTLDNLAIDARKAKLSSLRISKWQTRNDVDYRVLTMEFHLNKNTWDKKILDQGFREYDSILEKTFKITDEDGAPIRAPALLDGSGEAIANPEPSDAVFMTYKIYTEKDFSVLPLT